jgi:hypothetical protein
MDSPAHRGLWRPLRPVFRHQELGIGRSRGVSIGGEKGSVLGVGRRVKDFLETITFGRAGTKAP